MRSYCLEIFVHRVPPPQDPPNMKKSLFFHILGLNLKISYQIVSLCDMYIDMGERITGKQDRPSLIIEDPPQGPLNSPRYIFFLHFGSYIQTGFQIVSTCCTFVSIVMRAAFADISLPLVPLDFM